MKTNGFNFGGKHYVWAPSKKHIVGWALALGITVAVAGNFATPVVSAGTDATVNQSIEADYKTLELDGMLYKGDAKVTSIQTTNYDSHMATTEYGNLPLLASNSSAAKPGELVYLELGDTTDDDKCTVYWCIDGKDIVERGSVGLVNQSLTGTSYTDVAVYKVVAK